MDTSKIFTVLYSTVLLKPYTVLYCILLMFQFEQIYSSAYSGYSSTRLPPRRIKQIQITPASEALNYGVMESEMNALFRGYDEIIIIEFEPLDPKTLPKELVLLYCRFSVL